MPSHWYNELFTAVYVGDGEIGLYSNHHGRCSGLAELVGLVALGGCGLVTLRDLVCFSTRFGRKAM